MVIGLLLSVFIYCMIENIEIFVIDDFDNFIVFVIVVDFLFMWNICELVSVIFYYVILYLNN